MILVTGGAGYIGTHTILELVQSKLGVVVLDNFVNSSPLGLARVEMLLGEEITLVEGDVRDKDCLRSVFSEYAISSVIHFAGLKAVGESTENPLSYYDNNVSGTVSLLQVMNEYGCYKIVFSSSATVYGNSVVVPIREDSPLGCVNPYGNSKLMCETILNDLSVSDCKWSCVSLRYFNPVGAHVSGLIGEDPVGIPNNLMPYISQVASGRRESLNIFGNDYPTPDGTGVRDYIHVVDLAKGHLAALDLLDSSQGFLAVNLGTGRGYSVLEVVSAFERASGRAIPFNVISRRSGDVAECYADPSYAKSVLRWEAKLGLDSMCEDAWRWQSQNPNGYEAE